MLLVAAGCALAALLALLDGRRPLALVLAIVALLSVAEWHVRPRPPKPGERV